MSKKIPFPTHGVRIKAFRDLINRICGGEENIKSYTTNDVCEKFVKPITRSKECSYCELLQQIGDPNVDEANVFISHAWKFNFLDVVEAIEHHFQGNTNIVVWFDLFSNNQHAAPSLDFEWWSTTFKNAINLIHHTVLILYPWEDPIPLTRAWCLWEIYCTINTKSKFEIAMCRSERDQFVADIQLNICSLTAMIAHVNVAKSEAYRVDDKNKIFHAVEQLEGGFDHVNSVVFQTLRDWAIETVRSAVLLATSNERIYLIGSLAILYRRYGLYDLAEPCARYAAECAKQKFGSYHAFTLKCQNELVLLLDKRGKHVEACECARYCVMARQQSLGNVHPDTLASMQILGSILCSLKQYDEAERLLLTCYEESRAILGENHTDTLKAMFTLANLYFAEGRYDMAEPLYSSHPDSEHCRHFLMTIHAAQGKYEETCAYYKSRYEFSRTKLGASHPETLIYAHNLALIYCCMAMPGESVELLRECVTLRKSVLGMEHPDTLQSMFHLGRILQAQGYVDEAATLLNETLERQRKLLGPDHPDTQATALTVDEVGVYMPFLRYMVPVFVCPVYWFSFIMKASVRSCKKYLGQTMRLANIEDVTVIHDSLDECSIDEYNARQLIRGGAPLADECPIAAFIREVSPKSLSTGKHQQAELMNAVVATLAPDSVNGTDEKWQQLASLANRSSSPRLNTTDGGESTALGKGDGFKRSASRRLSQLSVDLQSSTSGANDSSNGNATTSPVPRLDLRGVAVLTPTDTPLPTATSAHSATSSTNTNTTSATATTPSGTNRVSFLMDPKSPKSPAPSDSSPTTKQLKHKNSLHSLFGALPFLAHKDSARRGMVEEGNDEDEDGGDDDDGAVEIETSMENGGAAGWSLPFINMFAFNTTATTAGEEEEEENKPVNNNNASRVLSSASSWDPSI